MQGGPTSTAPTKIPKKRPLSSSNGHAVQWRTKEERTAEEENYGVFSCYILNCCMNL